MTAEVSPCPFCNIAASNPPAPFNDPESGSVSSDSASEGTAHLILSTEHVLAFLDIMPLTDGHVLVAPRRHYEKLSDMGVSAGQEVCAIRSLVCLGYQVLSILVVAFHSIYTVRRGSIYGIIDDANFVEMGKWLPIISRVVTKTIFGDDLDRHWNVVQNNGR
jgi:hypothetical protein